MLSHLPHRFHTFLSSGALMVAATFVACGESTQPPSSLAARAAHSAHDMAAPGDPNSAAGDEKAFIHGWLDGKLVELRYTRSFYCEAPPTSVAPSSCEIGALPDEFPRGGPIPVIYAIAPIGFTPSDPSTLHCPGTPLCPNHPPMIDVTRLDLPGVSTVARAPHSHIITSRQAGWHRTVNIRVLSPAIWDQIVASPTLETVRQLQATQPSLISRDNPTNIFFFFFEVHSETPTP
jgi:hypothetical protein